MGDIAELPVPQGGAVAALPVPGSTVTPEQADIQSFSATAGPFRRGLRSGFNSIGGMLNNLAGQAGSDLGLTNFANDRFKAAGEYARFSDAVGPPIRDVSAIKDFNSLVDFVAGMGGQGAATSLPALGLAIGLRRPITGIMAGSFPLEAGEQIGNLRANPNVKREDILGNAVIKGGINAALEAVGGAPGLVARRILSPTKMLGGVAKDLAKVTASEGLTEGAQNLVGQVLHQRLDPTKPLDTKDLLNDIAAGAAGGFTLGAGGHIATGGGRALAATASEIRKRYGGPHAPLDPDGTPPDVNPTDTTMDQVLPKVDAHATNVASAYGTEDVEVQRQKFGEARTAHGTNVVKPIVERAIKAVDDAVVKFLPKPAATGEKFSLMHRTNIDDDIADEMMRVMPLEFKELAGSDTLLRLASRVRKTAENPELYKMDSAMTHALDKAVGGRLEELTHFARGKLRLPQVKESMRKVFAEKEQKDDRQLRRVQNIIRTYAPSDYVINRELRNEALNVMAPKMLDWLHEGKGTAEQNAAITEKLRDFFGEKADIVFDELQAAASAPTTVSERAYEAGRLQEDEGTPPQAKADSPYADKRLGTSYPSLSDARQVMRGLQSKWFGQNVVFKVVRDQGMAAGTFSIEAEAKDVTSLDEDAWNRVRESKTRKLGETDEEFAARGKRYNKSGAEHGVITVKVYTPKAGGGLAAVENKINLRAGTSEMMKHEKQQTAEGDTQYVSDMFSRFMSALVTAEVPTGNLDADGNPEMVSRFRDFKEAKFDAKGNMILPNNVVVGKLKGKLYTYGEIKQAQFGETKQALEIRERIREARKEFGPAQWSTTERPKKGQPAREPANETAQQIAKLSDYYDRSRRFRKEMDMMEEVAITIIQDEEMTITEDGVERTVPAGFEEAVQPMVDMIQANEGKPGKEGLIKSLERMIKRVEAVAEKKAKVEAVGEQVGTPDDEMFQKSDTLQGQTPQGIRTSQEGTREPVGGVKPAKGPRGPTQNVEPGPVKHAISRQEAVRRGETNVPVRKLPEPAAARVEVPAGEQGAPAVAALPTGGSAQDALALAGMAKTPGLGKAAPVRQAQELGLMKAQEAALGGLYYDRKGDLITPLSPLATAERQPVRERPPAQPGPAPLHSTVPHAAAAKAAQPEAQPEAQGYTVADLNRAVEGMISEIGADEVGGRMIKDETNAGPDTGERGRTSWLGQRWWFDRPVKLSEVEARTAAKKWLNGDRLTVREGRFMAYMREVAERNLAGEKLSLMSMQHVSPNDFSEFDLNRAGSTFKQVSEYNMVRLGKGVYASTNPDVIREYQDIIKTHFGGGVKYTLHVETADENILDAATPLKDQPPKLRAALKKLLEDTATLVKGKLAPIEDWMDAPAGAIPKALYLRFGKDAEAARAALVKAGVKAVRYQEDIGLFGEGGMPGNYAVLDPSVITITGKENFSTMNVGRGPVAYSEQHAAVAFLKHVLGDKVAVRFIEAMEAAGSFAKLSGVETIHIAANISDPMSVAYHEAAHAFVARLMQSNPAAARVLSRAASSPQAIARLKELLKDHPLALEQLADPEERVAYMYQFWATNHKGLLNTGPETEGIFNKIKSFFRQIMGLWGDNMQSVMDVQRAGLILEAFHSGAFANPNTVAEVMHERFGMETRERADKILPGLGRFMDKYVWASTTAVRDMGFQPLTKIMDRFYTPFGAKNTELGSRQTQHVEHNRRMNQVFAALKPLSESQRREVLIDLQSGKPRVLPAAQAIGRILDETYEYMRKAGVRVLVTDKETGKSEWVNINKLPYYFPRVPDMDTLMTKKGKEGFIELLKRHKISDPEGIYTNYTQGINAGSPRENDLAIGLTFFTPQLNKRTLAEIPDSELAPYLSKDLYGTLNQYIGRATRRAEYTSRFGNSGEVIRAAHLEAEKAGATPDQLKTFNEAVQAMEGTLGANMSQELKSFYGAMMTYQNIRLLPLQLFSSLVDPVGILIRGGTIGEATSALWRGLSDLASMKQDSAFDLATSIGAINAAIDQELMRDMYNTQYMPKTQQIINDLYFRYNGMESWNRSMRVAASAAAEQFIIRHTFNPNEHSKRYLEELNLKPEDVDVQQGKLVLNDKTRKALNQWVDESILRPDAALRPIYMSDPNWMLVSHLKQYMYLYQKTIIARVLHELEHGNYTPAYGLMGYVPMMIASDMLRTIVTPGTGDDDLRKNWTAANWLSRGVQRAGLYGPGQMAVDSWSDASFGKTGFESIAGPTLQQLMDFVRASATGGLAREAMKAIPGERLFR